MPELKNTFTGGKMDKDQDERILDNRSYREALNIEVFTTEDSDIGSAQNILGNIKVTHAIQGPKNDYVDCGIESIGYNRYQGTNKHIAHTVDPQSDKLYRFINTEPNNQNNHGVWMDRIVEYDTNANIQDDWNQKEKAVMVDVYKVGTNISSIDAPPPPPPGGKFWCNNGNCEPCNTAPPGTCTGGQPGANYATLQDCQNDPSYCGGATRGVTYCTNVSTHAYSNPSYGYHVQFVPVGTNINAQYFSDPQISNDSGIPTFPGFEDGGYAGLATRTIGQHGSDHDMNLRTHRYPIYHPYGSSAGVSGVGHHWFWHIGIRFNFVLDARNSNNTPVDFTDPSFVNNIPGIGQHGITFSTNHVGNQPNATFPNGPQPQNETVVKFWSISDAIRFVNAVPSWDGTARTPLPLNTNYDSIMSTLRNELTVNAGWTTSNSMTSHPGGSHWTGAWSVTESYMTCGPGDNNSPITDTLDNI